MRENLPLRLRLLLTLLFTVLFSAHLYWDYLHNGIPVHYLLHDENLPSFSNWWGLLTVPLTTWACLWRIKLRMDLLHPSAPSTAWTSKGLAFLTMILFGTAISYTFLTGWEIQGQLMLALGIAALVLPIYRAEYFLGFFLGMTYTFGAVLPLIIGAVFWTVFTLQYKVIRKGFLWVVRSVFTR